ncbi:MmcQ/YjbR family DNA-binding protein [uncultured Oscillibacter sp.]|uniref:MmcQ/YjbR family DNA-binding protein n=1 Tax=uncultured Oscillibacter sp. TaxID=876091 RepID=UPI00260DE1C6|nr:MmcQ/YjbR family DNA-binding protein [uncultured Oscillibacter sp.]
MNREALEAYLTGTYAAAADRPWARYPDYVVFRHTGNRKWFALVMRIPGSRLGLTGDGLLDVVNVKCDPLLIGSFRELPGIYPAYHMNKGNWLSVSLEEAGDETIKVLINMSYDLTAPGKRKGGGGF